jgi:hypothetical protein
LFDVQILQGKRKKQSNMGQDSESAAEFVMTVRTDHVAMKTWYNSDKNTNNLVVTNLKEKYGDYPSLWKEVLNWPGWKETRKEYIKFQQTTDNRKSENNDHTNSTSNQTILNDQSEQGGQSSNTATTTRKRKSRWGTASSSGDNSNIDGNDPDGRRQSRWGRDDQQSKQQQSTSERTPSTSFVPPLLLPGLLPGSNGISSVQLTPQQHQEMEELRSRLRVVNDKLEKVDSESERVDALPRSHPDRSPSPPPSKFTKTSRFDRLIFVE